MRPALTSTRHVLLCWENTAERYETSADEYEALIEDFYEALIEDLA